MIEVGNDKLSGGKAFHADYMWESVKIKTLCIVIRWKCTLEFSGSCTSDVRMGEWYAVSNAETWWNCQKGI